MTGAKSFTNNSAAVGNRSGASVNDGDFSDSNEYFFLLSSGL